jgi:hypothetical protein
VEKFCDVKEVELWNKKGQPLKGEKAPSRDTRMLDGSMSEPPLDINVQGSGEGIVVCMKKESKAGVR